MLVALANILVLTSTGKSSETRFIPVKPTSVVYCPQDHRIYVTAASDAQGNLGNSVCRIDPDTGKIEASVFVGDDPRGMIRSTDGKNLWVLVAGNKMVRQIDRATLKAGLTFPIGEGQQARKLATIPEVPDALIVERFHPGVSPSEDNLCVFTKGQPLMDGVPCGDQFTLGVDPARVITAGDNGTSNFYFGVNALLHTESGPGFFDGVHRDLRAGGYGLILSASGDVIDPEAHQTLGRLRVEGDGQVCVDPLRPFAYEIYNDQTPTLRCWNLQTFQEVWKAPLPAWSGPHHLSSPLRWGTNGLAYIDGDNLVCGPCNLGKKSDPVDLSVTRSGFPTGPVDGKTVTYTLTVTNNSGFPSTGAFLTDSIPGVVTMRETTASQGSAIFAQGVIRADLGSILAHSSATLKVKLDIQNRGDGGYCAVVRSFDPDPDTSNNIFPGPQFTPHGKLSLGNLTATQDQKFTWRSLGRKATGAGDNLVVEVNGELVIENNGKTTTAPSSVRFYLQDGPNLVVDWAVFLQECQIPALAPGETYVATLQAPLSIDLDVAGMFVVANVDPLKNNGQTTNLSQQIR